MNDKVLKVLKIAGYILTGAAAMLMTYVGNKEAKDAIPEQVAEYMSNMKIVKKD